jgi:hypothetical protein
MHFNIVMYEKGNSYDINNLKGINSKLQVSSLALPNYI